MLSRYADVLDVDRDAHRFRSGREALDGYTNVADFHAHLWTEPEVLRTRLSRLVDSGLMTRRGNDEYVLTGLGRSLRSVIIMLTASQNHRLPPRQRSMILVDSADLVIRTAWGRGYLLETAT